MASDRTIDRVPDIDSDLRQALIVRYRGRSDRLQEVLANAEAWQRLKEIADA